MCSSDLIDANLFTKSGLMVGLGEDREEVLQVMDDMRAANVDFLTIGQYLQPTPRHAAVERFVTPGEFAEYERIARAKGFLMVSATPLTRSSYHADADFARLKASLLTPAIFDGRNLYDPVTTRDLGFEYYPLGRPDLRHGTAGFLAK